MDPNGTGKLLALSIAVNVFNKTGITDTIKIFCDGNVISQASQQGYGTYICNLYGLIPPVSTYGVTYPNTLQQIPALINWFESA